MRLHHTDAAVPVDDESRQAVAFTVHQPVAVRLRIARQAGGGTDRLGAQEHPLPEIGFQRILAAEAQDADGDGTDLVVAVRQERTVGGENADDVALGGMPADLGDGTGENPGMEPAQGLFPTSFQYDLCHRHCSWAGSAPSAPA